MKMHWIPLSVTCLAACASFTLLNAQPAEPQADAPPRGLREGKPPAAAERVQAMNRKLEDLRAKARELDAAGQENAAAEVRQKISALEREREAVLRRAVQGRPDAAPGDPGVAGGQRRKVRPEANAMSEPDAARQMHLRQAIEHSAEGAV